MARYILPFPPLRAAVIATRHIRSARVRRVTCPTANHDDLKLLTPRGCAAAYYPETNPLIPLDSTAIGSNCPTSKSVIVRLEEPSGRAPQSGGGGDPVGSDEGHKSKVQPHHLS